MNPWKNFEPPSCYPDSCQCEAVRDAFIRQPSSFWSSLAYVMARMAPFHELFTSFKITQADFVASYILTYLSLRFPNTWPGARKEAHRIPGIEWRELPFTFEQNVLKRLEGIQSLQDIFSFFALKSTPMSVNRSILEWSSGRYQLELMFRIPGPREVLNQQKSGRRCVTALLDQRISKLILNERDALSFTMHDLIHADHFFHNNVCYRGQLGFYGLLDKTFEYFDLGHEKFAAEFEYLIADMNAYPIHLLKCLKSAMIHYFDEDYYKQWALTLQSPPASLMSLNTGDYRPETMDQEILNWLDTYRQAPFSSNLHFP